MSTAGALLIYSGDSTCPEEIYRLTERLDVHCVALGSSRYEPANVIAILFDLRLGHRKNSARQRRLSTLHSLDGATSLFLISRSEEAGAVKAGDAYLWPQQAHQLENRIRKLLKIFANTNHFCLSQPPSKLESNERANFFDLFQRTSELFCLFRGPEHVFEFVNEAHIRILGFDATGRTIREAQPEGREIHELLDQIYRTGESITLREHVFLIGRERKYFNIVATPRRSELGVVGGVMVLGQEITDEIVNRNRLTASEERLVEIIETIPQGVWRTNPDGAADYFSEQFSRMVNVPMADLLRWGWADIIHPDDQCHTINEWQRCRDNAQPVRVEFRAKVRGQYRWFLSVGNPFFDENGKLIKYFGTWTDIHDEHETQATLAANERELDRTLRESRFLFELAPVLFTFIEPGTARVIAVNDQALGITRLSRQEIVGKIFWELPWVASIPKTVERLQELCRSANEGNAVQADIEYWHESNATSRELRWVDARAIPVMNEAGEVLRIGLVGTDITERVHVAEALRSAKVAADRGREEAERANVLKSAFLANMSHEIRTPLGAMIGFTDLLRDPEIKESDRKAYLEILARNAENLSLIINDILDLSKVEAGHLALEYSAFDPEKIASEIVTLLSVKAKAKGIDLVLMLNPLAPHKFSSDPMRIRQVLLNLVGNALKFTAHGSVIIRSSVFEKNGDRSFLCFEVEDTGIGISPQQRESIFEMFVQADGSITRRFGGTGLGLALSRSLARAMGGDIVITQSEEGGGSTFRFTVEERSEVAELAPSFTPALVAPNRSSSVSPNLGHLRVLVVDDAPDNQNLITRYLNKEGAEVETASDGREGYEKALNFSYDVVLMDLQMPVMDGYTATAKLREAGFRGPIIALTAHAMGEVRRKCLDVGCNEQLTKPLRSKELISTIARLISHPTEH